jgi:hypothetical protein
VSGYAIENGNNGHPIAQTAGCEKLYVANRLATRRCVRRLRHFTSDRARYAGEETNDDIDVVMAASGGATVAR